MLSFRIFEDAGFHQKLRAVPEDNEGIDIEYLRQEIRKSEDRAKAEGNDEPVSTMSCFVVLHCTGHHLEFHDSTGSTTMCSKHTKSLSSTDEVLQNHL